MGSEAVLLCEERNEVYKLGKFQSTWTEMDWSRCDLITLTKRVSDQLLGEELEYIGEWDDGPVVALQYVTNVAKALYAYLESRDWKVVCVGDQDLRYEGRHCEKLGTWRVVGDRYADGEGRG